MSGSEEDLVAQLRRLGYQVTGPHKKPKPEKCAVCGAVSEDANISREFYDWTGIDFEETEVAEWLTEITVETNPSEEGFDHVKLFFCEQHDTPVILGLMKLGFVSHRHGGTALLADESCPGNENMNDCPTPEEDN